MPDEGQSFLNIPDSLGRDIDSGKAANRDITDFLPDSMSQQLLDMSSPGPVHAENLIPISAQQGAGLRTIDPASGSLPKMPATRRVIPAPYKRDRAVGGSHGKAWMLTTAEKIAPGDIVTDVGLITRVISQVCHDEEQQAKAEHIHLTRDIREGCPACFPPATGMEYEVTGAGGKILVYAAGTEVKVFRSRTS